MQRMNKYSWWSNRLVAVARISLSTEIIESHRKWSYCAARVEPELLLSLQISCPPRSCWWACETGHVMRATAPPAACHNNLWRQNSLDMGSAMSFKEVLLLVLTKALYFVYIWLPFGGGGFLTSVIVYELMETILVPFISHGQLK